MASRRALSRSERIKQVLDSRRRSSVTESRPQRVRRIVTSSKRDLKKPEQVYRSNRAVLITGGIGDVLALEGFLPESQRSVLSTIFYATAKYSILRQIFSALPNYPKIENHEIAWEDFSTFWCFYRKQDCVSRIRSSGVSIPRGLDSAQDLSIAEVFPMIKTKQLSFSGSSVLRYTLTEIDFDLPKKFVVICPFSSDKRDKCRDFDDADWKIIFNALEQQNLFGVVINSGQDVLPVHERLINYANQTNILQSIEILKLACGYWGVDSCLSVPSSELFEFPYLAVKSRNPHCFSNADCYYPKQSSLNFISPDFTSLEQYWKIV